MEVVNKLLKKYGTTFAEDAGFKVSNTPSALFKLLVMSVLASARISAAISTKASRALFKEGWTTPEKMKKSTWEQRVKVLDTAGYARYDERTSRMLEEVANQVIEKYGGDLRDLRVKAEEKPEQEEKLLKELKGIGSTGASIFLREVQNEWVECYPYVDAKAMEGAKRLNLPADAEELKGLVKKEDFPRFVASLVKAELHKENPKDI